MENVLVFGSIALMGVFFLWERFVYRPRSDARAAHSARLFDCMLTRQFLEGCDTPEARAKLLGKILLRRPALMGYPEWDEVWDGDDPLGRE